MMRKVFAILILLGSTGTPVIAADGIPVLVRVPRAEQHDTLGFNFVEQVTELVYSRITEGKIKLWDSPEKEIQITASTLNNIEKSSGTNFKSQEIIFIYENWQKTKTGVTSETIGFAFLNFNKVGEEVSYGYVDYNELKEVFMRSRINTNANGNYEINFASCLYKKLFNFNIVQFNGKPVTTGGESKDIKLKFIGNLEFNPGIILPSIADRFVTILIDDNKSPGDAKNKITIALLKQVENYMEQNEEIFYNLGGDRILNFIHNQKIKVTRIEAGEIWSKSTAGISVETKSVTIFVNDSALAPVAFDDFINWGIQVNDKSSYEIFREKDFTYIITAINSQKIARKDSYLYQKGLLTYDWNKLTEFVKYY